MGHRTRRIRWPVVALAGVLVAGGGTAYAVTNDGTTGNYRTVRAGKGDVEQVLATSGTVDAARRADLAFATSGTVASVKVALGDTVSAGQVVARLDTQDLDAAVVRARASVAKAVAQLQADEDSQDQTVTNATPSPQSTKPTSTHTPSGPATSTTTAALLQQLKAQQQAVISAQTAATAAIAAAKEALAAQVAACADAYQQPTASATPDATDQGTTSDQSSTKAAADDAVCSDALAAVQARQDDVRDAQDALAKALSTLSATLTKALTSATASSSGPSSTPSATPSSASGRTSGRATSRATSGTSPTSSGSTSPSATSGVASAAQLASDQAAIEQAKADLVDAQQQRALAVVRSTRAGKVVSLPIGRGDQVAAGDAAAVVVGGRAVTVTATVSESRIAQVKVGERVRVTTPGDSRSAQGTVTAIGLVADTSSGTASYPVTVTVEDPTVSLPAGSRAMLAIVVATAKDVVTVPVSAITRRGDAASVRTWDGTTLTTKSVTLGTVGATEVEVTQGLAAGDQVVLADVDQAINGAANSINDRAGFGGPAVRFDRSGQGGGPPVTFKSGG